MEDKLTQAHTFVTSVVSDKSGAGAGISAAINALQAVAQDDVHIANALADPVMNDAIKCLRSSVPDERGAAYGAAATLDLARVMIRRDELKALMHQHTLPPPPPADALDEELFNLLSGCPHGTVHTVLVGGEEDPALYESMTRSWLGRVHYARIAADLYAKTGMSVTKLAEEYNLEARRLRCNIAFGAALLRDPELGCRLVNSSVPFVAFAKAFSFERYLRIQSRLHAAWGTAKRTRPE